MRKIKFRGKAKFEGKDWVYGHFALIDNAPSILSESMRWEDCSEMSLDDWSYIHDETLCQFTGVYDINGKEIYENDIVDTYPFERGYGVFTVSFARGYEEDLGMAQGWYLQQGNFERYIPLRTSNEETEKVEVIGNIFDNPNLVEQ